MRARRIIVDAETTYLRGDPVGTPESLVESLVCLLAAADRQIAALNERVDLLLDAIDPGATWGYEAERVVPGRQVIKSPERVAPDHVRKSLRGDS